MHNNAGSLHQLWKIPYHLAKEIINNSSTCRPLHLRPFAQGINPRGLQPNELWQMDVTHCPELSPSPFLHVCIDTNSSFILATPLRGEATQHVIIHLLACFAIMGTPSSITTDNGPDYTSRYFKQFLQSFPIKHITGIPYNPQAQGIVERAHHTLKLQIKKFKKGKYTRTLLSSLSKADFTKFQHKIFSKPVTIVNTALFVLFFFKLTTKGYLDKSRKTFRGIEGFFSSSWHPTPVPLPGESHGQRSLVGLPRGRKESDTTERLHFLFLCLSGTKTG